jgi:GT2 family glycosyltransferase
MAKRSSRRRGIIPPANNSKPVLLDIVIPVYGCFDLLKTCLEYIPAAVGNCSYRVRLVDNFSPDQAEADTFYTNLDKLYPNTEALRLKENRGFGAACNYGAQRSNSKYLLFLNTDAYMLPGSIQILVDEIDKDKNIGIIGAKLLFPEGSAHGPEGKIQHAGLNFNIRAGIDHTFIGWSADHPVGNRPGKPVYNEVANNGFDH